MNQEKHKSRTITIMVIVVAMVIVVGLYKSSPKSKRIKPGRPVPIVETVEINARDMSVFIEALGTVIPARQVSLQSEVAGKIVSQSRELIPGGLFRKDEVVVQLDPVDYRMRLEQVKAVVEDARLEFEVEKGRQAIAKWDWETREKKIKSSDQGKSLALREPHLRRAVARLDAALSKLKTAELDLKRTTILAPFNGLILEKFTDMGQIIDRRTPIATLVGTDRFWVQVSVPVSRLERINLPDTTGRPGSDAEIIMETGGGGKISRRGRVLKAMGDLDPKGRMARILIAIDNPLNLIDPTPSKPNNHPGFGKGAILLGSFVKVRIEAGMFHNIYVIPRRALREGDVVWLTEKEGLLKVRKVDVVWRKKNDVLVSMEKKSGEVLITSRLSSPLPGIKVKTSMNMKLQAK